MSIRDSYYVNDDGLVVGFGTRKSEQNTPSTGNRAGQYGEITMDIVATELELLATVVAAGGAGDYASAAKLPSGSSFVGAKLTINEDFTSSGAPTLEVGTYSWNEDTGALIEIDDSAFVSAAVKAELTKKTIHKGTNPVDGATGFDLPINSADTSQSVVIVPTKKTADVFSAGKAQLVITYKLA